MKSRKTREKETSELKDSDSAQKFKRISDIPKKKKEAVNEITRLMNESNTIMLVSIKNLPAKQFQLIKRQLKENAEMKVVKKSIINKAIDSIERGMIKNLKSYIKEDTALIFSKLDPFELSLILSQNKSMARAKIGQVIEEDIFVEPGPTELVPGPVISELSSLGIKFSIEDGKINIRERKIIVKAGEKVNEAQVSIMSKFDMKPIAVGLEPLMAYDAKEDKIYENVKIDQKKTLEELKECSGKALGLAVKIAYYCKETIKFLLAKASAESRVLNKKINENVGVHEEKTEEKSIKQENIQGGQ